MHELEITQNILLLALTEASKENAKKILKISIVVGKMFGIEPDSVSFYFSIITKNTIAEEAILDFHLVKTTVSCQSCCQEFFIEEETWLCPNCQNSNLKIISGKEFFMESIEVD